MCAAVSVIRKIFTDDRVAGITSVDDELFVLLRRDRNQVAVYSINDYQLLRHLNVPRNQPGYMPGNCSDITSCTQRKCLYMSDWDNSCIHRCELASSATSKWSVPGKPPGLAITPSGNLLVTCQHPNKLVELSVDSGESVREIALQSDIEYPHDSMQLSPGQLLVCHGYLSTLHRLCIVGDDGKVTRSYSGQGEQLQWPRHFAVDKDSQLMFVADEKKARVALVSPSKLEFVRYVIESVTMPHRIYFHQATRRLFVGKFHSRDITVVQM